MELKPGTLPLYTSHQNHMQVCIVKTAKMEVVGSGVVSVASIGVRSEWLNATYYIQAGIVITC